MNLAPEAGVSQGMVDVDMKVSLQLLAELPVLERSPCLACMKLEPLQAVMDSVAEQLSDTLKDSSCYTPFHSASAQICMEDKGRRERAASDKILVDSHSCNLQGSDWNGQVKLGNGQFVGVNYLQSVTPNLALGGEAFWLGQQRKSGAGFAARYADKEHVATAQVATTGLVSLAYLRRLSEKVCLHLHCC